MRNQTPTPLGTRSSPPRGLLHLAVVLASTTTIATSANANNIIVGSSGSQLRAQVVAQLQDPWALSFINAQQLLVSTKSGQLWLANTTGQARLVEGVPTVFVGGQGGMGDVVPHPNFANNQLVYLSYVNSTDGGQTRFATVARARLDIKALPLRLTHLQTIWQQTPAHSGKGHFSHRLAFAPANSAYAGQLFISSGDRQEMEPAQAWSGNLGKIVRLNADGSVPADNPFQGKGQLAATVWTTGHRNVLGLAFNNQGELWAHEMGPRNGDELNRIKPGRNYGWPLVSEGRHYSGWAIPSHSTRPEFQAPALFWDPTIAPSGLAFYNGKQFAQWQDHAFIGGLRSQALIRVSFNNGQAAEAERFSWQRRVRDVEVSPDGAIWVLEDGPSGRLLRLSKPAS